MRRAACIVLIAVFNYSKLVGCFPMEYNTKTGRFYTRKLLTVYGAVANVLLLLTLPFLFGDDMISDVELRHHLLHLIVYLSTGAIRLSVALMTMFFNWTKRCEIISITNDFQNLHENYFKHLTLLPEDRRQYYKAILHKILCAFTTESTMFVTGIYSLRDTLTWQLMLRFILIIIWVETINLVILQGYLATLVVNSYFSKLNAEFIRILNVLDSDVVGKGPLPLDAYNHFNENLEKLMSIHWRLAKLFNHMNKTIEWQCLCISLGIYFHTIGLIYFFYTVVVRNNPMMSMTPISLPFLAISFITYIYDLYITYKASMDLLDTSAKCCLILKEKGALSSLSLGRELEQNLDRFALQWATQKPVISVCGLYEVNREFVFLTFSSTFLNALLLMLFDYEYF